MKEKERVASEWKKFTTKKKKERWNSRQEKECCQVQSSRNKIGKKKKK